MPEKAINITRYGRRNLWDGVGWSGEVSQTATSIGEAIEQEFDYLMHRDTTLVEMRIEKI